MQPNNRTLARPLTCCLAIILFLTALAPAATHVLLISVDGLRPDVALRANMPNLRALMQQGAFTFWATTTPAAITLPSHASMLTGVTIERHGIVGNTDEAAAKEKLLVPTLFDLAKAAHISTGIAAGKSKFSIFAGAADHALIPAAIVIPDLGTANTARAIIHDFAPTFMFVHFGENDRIGHADGWGSPAQIDALANTDAQIGRIFDLLREMKLYDQTVILVTSDHGGSGRMHGADDDRSKFIPWIIAGPGIAANRDLSMFRDLHVQTYDTFATLCHVLEIKPPEGIDGKVVEQAFTATELIHATPTTQQHVQEHVPSEAGK